MGKAVIATTRLAPPLALLGLIAFGLAATPAAAQAPAGDYQRVVLVSWDGASRDVLLELLERTSPMVACWDDGDVFPVATGRVDSEGAPIYTCLPALAGARPTDAPAGSPAYAPFQMLASHTTNDGATMTKPQHASMLSGYNTETHGITKNVSKVRLAEGMVIYERLMNVFDPVGPDGRRNGTIFRTHHSSDRKYVGRALYRWAKRNRALQKATGHGNGQGDRPGPLRHVEKSFVRWSKDELDLGLTETDFFTFIHFKPIDWAGHRNGEGSRQYRKVIIQTDRKLYTLLEMLRFYGWEDAAVLITTDHGFHHANHVRNGGRTVFNTWLGAYNVDLSIDHIPTRTAADYCASHADPDDCLTNGPDVPMPAADVAPNVFVTSVVPTLLDMFGVEWRTSTDIEGVSLYTP